MTAPATRQAETDAIHAEIVAKLNATLPPGPTHGASQSSSRLDRPAGRTALTGAPRSVAGSDTLHAEIVAKLNAPLPPHAIPSRERGAP